MPESTGRKDRRASAADDDELRDAWGRVRRVRRKLAADSVPEGTCRKEGGEGGREGSVKTTLGRVYAV